MMRRYIPILFPLAALVAASCSHDDSANCPNPGCPADGGGGGTGAATTGGGGSGGIPECTEDIDCTDAMEAQCDNGTCVPCANSEHCTGVEGLPVCEGGTCIECKLGEEDACMGGQTCDLLQNICVDVAPGDVETCEPCTNDVQCEVNHKCIPLDYPTGTLHGYFCLEPPSGSCDRPYVPVSNKTSISGEPATQYCGINQAVATCEAVLALQAGYFCTTDGACSMTMGGNDFPVEGAICRDLFGGAITDRCTYRCSTDETCPDEGSGQFCGDVNGTDPPDFCGGDTM